MDGTNDADACGHMSVILPSRIDTVETLALHLEALAARDPRLAPVIALCPGLVPRVAPKGFEGLARVIVGQMVSTQSGAAIWGRVRAFVDPFTPEQFLALGPDAVRACGLTRAKTATLLGLAKALANGTLDLDRIAQLPADEAIAALTALKGIGVWTAEVYLLFAEGHADVFPAGDLALQKAVAQALELAARPDAAALRALAEGWAPHRGVAATLFWHYYAETMQRQGSVL